MSVSELAQEVVNEEIDAIKKLEAGPTEAELRRRRIVEIDEGLQEERVDRLRRLALRELNRSLATQKISSRREKMLELKVWINKMLNSDDEKLSQRVMNELLLSQGRSTTLDGYKVDFQSYLDKKVDQDSDDGYSDDENSLNDDDEEEDEDNVDNKRLEKSIYSIQPPTIIDINTKTPVNNSQQIASTNKIQSNEDTIMFSDDDDDEEEVEDNDRSDKENNIPSSHNIDGKNNTLPSHTDINVNINNTADIDNTIIDNKIEVSKPQISKQLKLKFMFPEKLLALNQNKTKLPTKVPIKIQTQLHGRAALKQSLMKKVIIASKENLCKQMNIRTNQLDIYKDVVNKCRMFIEIIRDREDTLLKKQKRMDEEARIKRREQFLLQAYDDNEEFDENDDDDEDDDNKKLTATSTTTTTTTTKNKKMNKMSEEEKQRILKEFENWPEEEFDVEEEDDNDNDDNNNNDEGEDNDEENNEENKMKTNSNSSNSSNSKKKKKKIRGENKEMMNDSKRAERLLQIIDKNKSIAMKKKIEFKDTLYEASDDDDDDDDDSSSSSSSDGGSDSSSKDDEEEEEDDDDDDEDNNKTSPTCRIEDSNTAQIIHLSVDMINDTTIKRGVTSDDNKMHINPNNKDDDLDKDKDEGEEAVVMITPIIKRTYGRSTTTTTSSNTNASTVSGNITSINNKKLSILQDDDDDHDDNTNKNNNDSMDIITKSVDVDTMKSLKVDRQAMIADESDTLLDNDDDDGDEADNNDNNGNTDKHRRSKLMSNKHKYTIANHDNDINTTVHQSANITENNESEGHQDDTIIDMNTAIDIDIDLSSNTTTTNTIKKDKNRNKQNKVSDYRRMVEEEERKARRERLNRNHLLEVEAEEEEEEGIQAGLGDFGFGVSRAKDDDETDALRIRKGDFDNIVDDLSDDEGDEEAAIRARADLDRREDRERTKAVIQAVTEGHNNIQREKSMRGKYTYDKLIRGRDEAELLPQENDENNEKEYVEDEEEFDEEELLQRGLEAKVEREKYTKQILVVDSDEESYYNSSDEASDDDDDDEDDEENNENRDPNDINYNENKVLKKQQERQLRKEMAKKEAIKIRQFSMQAKIRRTFRRIQVQNTNITHMGSSQNSSLYSHPSLFNILDASYDTTPTTTTNASTPKSIDSKTNNTTTNNTSNSNSNGHSGADVINPELLLTKPSELFDSIHSATDMVTTINTSMTSGSGNGNMSHPGNYDSNMRDSIYDNSNDSTKMKEVSSVTTNMSKPLSDITNMPPPQSKSAGIKRRTSHQPKQLSGDQHPLKQARKLSHSNDNGTSTSTVRTTALYTGALNTAEVQAGYGMGMAITASSNGLRRGYQQALSRSNSYSNCGHSVYSTTSINSNETDNLFSSVTGLKRSSSEHNTTSSSTSTLPNKKLRHKLSSSSGSTVTSVSGSQFVFMDTNNSSSMMTSSSSHLDDSSHGHNSNPGGYSNLSRNSNHNNNSMNYRTNSNSGMNTTGNTSGGGIASSASSLFAQLNSRGKSMNNNTTTSTSNGSSIKKRVLSVY